MEKVKKCCFTGHRPQKLGFSENSIKCDELKSILKENIISLIKQGVTHFISGMAIGVDTYAAQIVLELKKEYPDIILECALPCETQASKWREVDRETYFNILEQCDIDTLLQTRYTNDCMMKRNMYMVDNSDYIIAVWNGKPSGTGNTVEYANRKGKKIIEINPSQL